MKPVVSIAGITKTYATGLQALKRIDLDIREVTWWIPDDLSHTSIQDKSDFFKKNVTSERFKKHGSLKDFNKDGKIDLIQAVDGPGTKGTGWPYDK